MSEKQIQNIGVFSSGGDAPGMNAAIRAVVRTAKFLGKNTFGIKRGFEGMIDDDIEKMGPRSVSNIIQTGGTIIKSSRSERFLTPEGIARAYENLQKHGIDGLVAIGGDGTFHGCVDLHREYDVPIVGVPGTIDNDLYGTDFTIGYDTAVNTALEAIDKLRDTSQSHDMFFIVEVMGRHAGFIGLESGIAGGAEDILIPEIKTDLSEVCANIIAAFGRGKNSHIIIVAEGDDAGGANEIGKKIKDEISIDYRVVILGHIQRGGRPTAKDRLLASKLGYHAVKSIIAGKCNVMVGEVNSEIVLTPIKDTFEKKKNIDMNCVEMAKVLSN